MYSVFLSRIELGMDLIVNQMTKIIPKNPKVAILPWSFPTEIDGDKLINEFFKKGEKRYNRYINELKKIGVNEENITICNCYKDNTLKLKRIIKESDVLVLPGGNPEMFYSKVVQDTEILYDIKYFKGIIIGESAGTELQLKRYFITAKNNYYKYFAFYDGFGVLDDPFYIDVHSINNKRYLEKLQKISNEKGKKVYAIFDNGAMIYDRSTSELEMFGNVLTFEPKK